jgi:hypothetical protein
MGFELGGTPFTQTVMASRPMIERFKANHKVDITNVIYLTDGEGCGCFTFPDIKPSPMDPVTCKPKFEQYVYLVDQKTKQRVEFRINDYSSYIQNFHQTPMTQFVRNATRCKHIGFYVGDSRSILATIRKAMGEPTPEQEKVVNDFWKENGYYGMPNIGYDMYYYVRQSSKNLDDGDYDLTSDMSSKKMGKVFSDAQADKRKHRVLVSTFAKDIAA